MEGMKHSRHPRAKPPKLGIGPADGVVARTAGVLKQAVRPLHPREEKRQGEQAMAEEAEEPRQ